MAGYHLLFKPWFIVLNFCIKYSSRFFLYWLLCFFTFSSTVIFISLRLWPGRQKWAPVAWVVSFLVTYPRWSANLNLSVRFVSPIYLILHLSFWHSIMYTTLNELQVAAVLIFQSVFELILTFFPSSMNGHAVQLFPHLFIPFKFRFGYLGSGSGSCALIK